MPYYAVANGRNIGVFLNWDDCKKSVSGYKNALYKKFDTKEEADNFIKIPESQTNDNNIQKELDPGYKEQSSNDSNEESNGVLVSDYTDEKSTIREYDNEDIVFLPLFNDCSDYCIYDDYIDYKLLFKDKLNFAR
jgi:viroplasmin and RNaseH domain-containing protein